MKLIHKVSALALITVMVPALANAQTVSGKGVVSAKNSMVAVAPQGRTLEFMVTEINEFRTEVQTCGQQGQVPDGAGSCADSLAIKVDFDNTSGHRLFIQRTNGNWDGEAGKTDSSTGRKYYFLDGENGSVVRIPE